MKKPAAMDTGSRKKNTDLKSIFRWVWYKVPVHNRYIRILVCSVGAAGCGGSVVKSTGWHQTEDAVVPSSIPAPPTVSWTGPGNMTDDCVLQKQISGWEASLPE
jgi:hypothetical protein